MNIYDLLQPQMGDPKSISGKIQEWLGAKEPQSTSIQGLLTERLKPSGSDIGQAAVMTLFGGKPVSGQQFADERQRLDDERFLGSLEKLGALQKIQSSQQEMNQKQRLAEINEQIMEKIFPGRSLSVRNNNPGNLRPVGQSTGFQQFSSPEEGMNALKGDLLTKIKGNSKAMTANYGQGYSPTITNIISTWAPPTENDTQSYINFVSQKMGVSPDDPLTPEQADALSQAIIQMEGGQEASEYYQPVQVASNDPMSGINEINQMRVMAALAGGDTGEALKVLSETQNPDPSTEIGKMQRDESLGLVPKGSTQNLINQKNRQVRKEELEVQAAERAKQQAAEQEKVTREVANTKVTEAFNLLKNGGMNVGGLSATASLMLPGKATDADRLSSVYSTLKSVISLDKLMEMKKASPTGASGFGALSAPELQLLVDSVAALDPELPIRDQEENLRTIMRILGYTNLGENPNWSQEKESRYQELLQKRSQ